MLRCLNCGEEREENYFSKTKNKSIKTVDVLPYHFWLKKCKICQGVKTLKGSYNKLNLNDKLEQKLKKQYQLSKECLSFLEELKRRKGYINYVDSYRMLLYFDETFGYISTELDDMKVEEQLVFMYNKLLEKINE